MSKLATPDDFEQEFQKIKEQTENQIIKSKEMYSEVLQENLKLKQQIYNLEMEKRRML